MTTLLIVESPSKCAKIKGFLGTGYEVLASIGHLRVLDADIKAIGIERDFEPTYVLMDGKSQVVKRLTDAARDADTVMLASDDDAEGEAIAFHICYLLKLPIVTTPRVVFHEITADVVRAAVAAPRIIDMNRVNSQQARAMLDLLIGFTLSPLLWGFGKGLSAGRCQTPALGLLCDRETEIEKFTSKSTFPFTAIWARSAPTRTRFPSTLITPVIESYEDAMTFANNIGNVDKLSGIVSKITDSTSTSKPPVPFMTATLQQAASSMLGMSPVATMASAQRLYHDGHITYMRTDSCELSKEAQTIAAAIIRGKFGSEYVAMESTVVQTTTTSKKNVAIKKTTKAGGEREATFGGPTREEPTSAHEAIRPTHFDVETAGGAGPDQRLYALIWRRTLQSQMTASRSTVRKAIINATTTTDTTSTWSASWERLDFPGWRILEPAAAGLLDDDDTTGNGEDVGAFVKANAAFAAISGMKQGDKVSCCEIKMIEKLSQPPTRYTEASLVSDLKTYKIGRPSTYAHILDAITSRGYVVRETRPGISTPLRTIVIMGSGTEAVKNVKEEKTIVTLGTQTNKLFITPIGRKIYLYLMSRFDNVFNYGYTGTMNDELENVAAGGKMWKDVLRQLWSDLQPRISDAKTTNAEKAKEARDAAKDGRELPDSDTSRSLGEGIRIIVTRYGPRFVIPYGHTLLEDFTSSAPTPATPAINKKTGKPMKIPKVNPDRFFTLTDDVTFETATIEDARTAVEIAKTAAALETATDGPLGSYNGHAIILKKGPFGWYLQAGNVKVPSKEDVGREEAIALVTAKATAFIREISDMISVRQGPKGGFYVMKTALGKNARPTFRKLPDDYDPNIIGLDDCMKILDTPPATRGRGGRGGRWHKK